MSRTGRIACIVAFLVVVAVPGLLTLARPPDRLVDNRAPASLPSVRVQALADRSWFTRTGRYLQDRMALRNRAIAVSEAIDEDLFQVPPAGVVRGREGWLFLAPRGECEADRQIAAVRGLLGADLGDARVVVVVPPEKSAVYPGRLPRDSSARGRCAVATMDRVRSTFAGDPSVVDVWSALRSPPPSSPLLYFRLDTHWAPAGAGRAAARLVDELGPGRWDPAAVVPAPADTRTGDLTLLLGRPATESAPGWRVERPGVTVDAEGTDRTVATSDGPWLLPGRTVVVHDSFGAMLRPHLSPYLADATYITWDQVPAARASGLFEDADTVVLEAVSPQADIAEASGLTG